MSRRAALGRIWKYIAKGDGENACWLWTGARRGQKKQYPVILGDDGKLQDPGKILWEHHHGSLFPPNLWITRGCGAKLCVNPDHVHASTPKDLQQEAMIQSRVPSGKHRCEKCDAARMRRRRLERLLGRDLPATVAV